MEGAAGRLQVLEDGALDDGLFQHLEAPLEPMTLAQREAPRNHPLSLWTVHSELLFTS